VDPLPTAVQNYEGDGINPENFLILEGDEENPRSLKRILEIADPSNVTIEFPGDRYLIVRHDGGFSS
jgi:hypothetical protein